MVLCTSENSPQPFCLIKAEMEAYNVSISFNYHFLFQQNRPLPVPPCGYRSNIPHYGNHYAYMSHNKCSGEEQTGSITAGGSLRVSSVSLNAFNWPQTNKQPPSSLCLSFVRTFLLARRLFAVFSCLTQSSLNTCQWFLKSSFCVRLDKCTSGGSGVNIKYVITASEYSDY